MLERRTFNLSELRAKSANGMGISGHAAVFNQLSDDLGGWKEQIRPGAFSNSINTDDIRSLWNHDANFVLGRNKSGTLTLKEDQYGLHIDNNFPDTTYARDLLKVIERGDVSQMSFGFITLRDDYRLDGGMMIRELIEAQLFDVSPVTYPAYPQTDVGLRAMIEARSVNLKKPIAVVEAAGNADIRKLFLERKQRLDAIY